MPVDTDELEEVRRLLQQAESAAEYPLLGGLDLDVYLDKLLHRAEIITIRRHNRLHGFAAYYCNDLASRVAFLSMMAVAPEARGQGLGKALLEAVLAEARTRGFHACRLEVHPDNLVARQLYQRSGFVLRAGGGVLCSMERVL